MAWLRHPLLGEQAAALDYLKPGRCAATRGNTNVLIRAVVRLAETENFI